MSRNEIYDRFCDGYKKDSEPKPLLNSSNTIDVPSNDNDIEGIYRYLGWHMYKHGMSSNCFHYLEVLWKRATGTGVCGAEDLSRKNQRG